MPNKGLVPSESVQVISSVDAKQGLVPSVSVQVISSVDAKQGPRPKGISSGYPKCRCQTRSSSQGNQFRVSQVSMPNKGLVPRESIQASPSVDAKKGLRPKGISSGLPKCQSQTRASSQGNQFSPSQVIPKGCRVNILKSQGLLKSESLVVVPPFCIQLKSKQSSLAFMISLDFQMSSLLLFFVYLFSCSKAQNNIVIGNLAKAMIWMRLFQGKFRLSLLILFFYAVPKTGKGLLSYFGCSVHRDTGV